jgi:glycosyltransferase involved in cell wall biosynthesis
MPSYNAAPYLSECVRSVLAQTFTDFEFLIIDDGSTDGTADVMRTFDDPRIRYIRHDDNAGLAVRLNEGLRLARGEYITRMDADDVCRPDRVAAQVQALDTDPELDLIAAKCVFIDDCGSVLSWGVSSYRSHELLWHACIDCPFLHSAVTFRRTVILDKLGGYDHTVVCGEDYELWSRFLRAGFRGRQSADILVAVRRHRSSMTRRLREDQFATNLDTIRQNVGFVFPDVGDADRDRFAEHIAAVNFGKIAISPEFVREYWAFFRRYRVSRGLSAFKMRRVLSSHLIRWGSFGKTHMRLRALKYVLEGVLLEPRHIGLFVLPAPARRFIARRAGQFWSSQVAVTS